MLKVPLTTKNQHFVVHNDDNSVVWRQWGTDLETTSIQQMKRACSLPVSVMGALMPDAHPGYGLPIGGVLATANAVIPYAVGVDIACRVKLSVYDLPYTTITSQAQRLINAIEDETRFGIGANFRNPHNHEVMHLDWDVSSVTKKNKDKAQSQLGTSGSGNHFVEFGTFTLDQEFQGLRPATYLALLSHSGSRGTGASVCQYYSQLAQSLHPEMQKAMRELAWLDIDHDTGREYWAAMQLMGEYAKANHELIHKTIAKAINAKVILDIENHHNYAWKETHNGLEVIVHRKGATPAGIGALGIIPGSMASPCYVVKGKGSTDSLNSAAHGAGRVMSRNQAKKTYRWSHVKPILKEKGITVISAGLDEIPLVYKDIDTVMHQQSDLVESVGCFEPKIVKMAREGEKAED